MDEEVQMFIDDAEEKMEKSLTHLDSELSKIRAGKANPQMLDGILVDYYGVNTPLNQVSNISTPDPRTIMIQPWEKSMIEPIEKSIMQANIGLTPLNNGELIRITIPALTEERRLVLVKQVKSEGENSKISIRNARKYANDEFKLMQKEGLSEDDAKKAESEVQRLTDDYSKNIDELVEIKEQDIMKI